MTSVRRKTLPAPPADRLLTSEDIFGDMVDAPIGPDSQLPAETLPVAAPPPPPALPTPVPMAPAEARPGRQYGPYRLIERVATGGMAEVFKAAESGIEGFEKVVALKRILPHLARNKELVEMFIDEAKMVAGMSHPNIVQIFDLGRIDRSYYIAMEYVPGRDLRSIQRRAKDRGIRLPLDISVHVVSKVCSALEFAHRKKDNRGRPMKIVHRDISPQNILISFEGDVKLTDFGIAKAATKAKTTDANLLRGKLLYMSPEQASGKPLDHRSDLFSLGIVFYELLTGEKPFQGTSEQDILEMVRQCRIVAPTRYNPRIPEGLERVSLKTLAKDADQRYQDAGGMARALERAFEGRRPASSRQLARLMEVLFDVGERTPEEGGEKSLTDPGAAGLEMDFDPAAAAAVARRARGLSIEELIVRFRRK